MGVVLQHLGNKGLFNHLYIMEVGETMDAEVQQSENSINTPATSNLNYEKQGVNTLKKEDMTFVMSNSLAD